MDNLLDNIETLVKKHLDEISTELSNGGLFVTASSDPPFEPVVSIMTEHMFQADDSLPKRPLYDALIEARDDAQGDLDADPQGYADLTLQEELLAELIAVFDRWRETQREQG